MMEFTPFQMFGPQHMLTIFATFGIALIVPYYFKNSDEETKKIAGISISVIIAYQLITQAFTTFTFNLPRQIKGKRGECLGDQLISNND